MQIKRGHNLSKRKARLWKVPHSVEQPFLACARAVRALWRCARSRQPAGRASPDPIWAAVGDPGSAAQDIANFITYRTREFPKLFKGGEPLPTTTT